MLQGSNDKHSIGMEPLLTLAKALSRSAVLVFTLMCLSGLSPAAAQDQSPESDLRDPDKTTSEELEAEEFEEGTAIDSVHDALAEGVTGAATWFDSFFSDPQYEAELNKTQLKVIFDNFFEEGDGHSFNTRVRLRLAFPGISDRLVFTAAASPDEDDSIDDLEDEDISQDIAGTDEEFAQFGLDYFFANDDRASISGQSGVRFSGGAAGYFGGRYRRLFELTDTWNFRFIERLRWYTNTGAESITRFQFERLLAEDFLLRLEARGSWFEDEPGYYYNPNVRLFQAIDGPGALEYQWNNLFETKPRHRLDEVQLRVRYRQPVWRDWLIFEIAPQLAFPEDRDYEATPGIMLRVETRFGG